MYSGCHDGLLNSKQKWIIGLGTAIGGALIFVGLMIVLLTVKKNMSKVKEKNDIPSIQEQ